MGLDKKRRSLKTSYYTDPYIENLDRDEHDIFLTLLLNPQNNLAGVYEISLKKIATYAKMNQTDTRNALNNLIDDGKIMYSNSWVAIKNHIKNQSINPKMSKNVMSLLTEVPMQMKVFILMDINGNMEKWVQLLLDKIEDYHNSKIKLQLKKENIKFDISIHGNKYEQDQFLVDINGVDNSNISNNKAHLSLPKDSINKKNEKGRMKNEKGRMKEEVIAETEKPTFKPSKGFVPENKTVEEFMLLDSKAQGITSPNFENDNLHNIVKEIFLSKNNNSFDNYAKEGSAIKSIISKSNNRENPEEFLKSLLSTYYELTTGNDNFWNGQPFLPSILNANAIFPRVVKQLEKSMSGFNYDNQFKNAMGGI